MSGFEPTYKELKQRPIRASLDGLGVLSLPIRNWNNNKGFQKGGFKVRFEPTYKELKQCNDISLHL